MFSFFSLFSRDPAMQFHAAESTNRILFFSPILHRVFPKATTTKLRSIQISGHHTYVHTHGTEHTQLYTNIRQNLILFNSIRFLFRVFPCSSRVRSSSVSACYEVFGCFHVTGFHFMNGLFFFLRTLACVVSTFSPCRCLARLFRIACAQPDHQG